MRAGFTGKSQHEKNARFPARQTGRNDGARILQLLRGPSETIARAGATTRHTSGDNDSTALLDDMTNFVIHRLNYMSRTHALNHDTFIAGSRSMDKVGIGSSVHWKNSARR